MQSTSTSSVSSSPISISNRPDAIAEAEAQIRADLCVKLKIDSDSNEMEQQLHYESEEEDDDDSDEEEFTFACVGADSLQIAAEDAFQNGHIRPIYPLFNRDLLLSGEDLAPTRDQLPHIPPVKNVFVQSRETGEIDRAEEDGGPYCAWSKKAVEVSPAAATAPEGCKKSNSTGFSKIWRFRDLLHRSNSDGRDAFVFLNGEEKVERSEAKVASPSSSAAREAKTTVASEKAAGKANKAKKGAKTASLSAHEAHYRRNRERKEEDRRRSYLPYRPGLVGFFTNVNGGLSKTVHHPF